MPWLFLTIGIVGEIAWVLTLKATQGYTLFWPSVLNMSLAVLNIIILAQAFKALPTASAYAIWIGASTVGVAVLGVFFYGEPMTVLKILCMTLVVVGVIGLKMIAV